VSALTIDEAHEVTPELVAAFERLVPHLSKSSPPPGKDELAEMVDAPGTFVLVARLASDGDDEPGAGEIVGTLTLVCFRIPTGVRAWIDDVVVDDAARGRGVGEVLVRAALDRAVEVGARTVDLTSRPSREAAIRLYERCGFVRRDSTLFRWTPPEAG